MTSQLQHRRSALLLALLVALWVGGCQVQPEPVPARGTGQAPPDFSLVLQVRGPTSDPDPLRQASYFVLQPNRQLYVASGTQALWRTFPRDAITLAPAEMQHIYDLVAQDHLFAEPTSPLAQALPNGRAPAAPQHIIGEPLPTVVPHERPIAPAIPDKPIPIDVELTAHSRFHSYTTTAQESPPTVRLLAVLIHLAAGRTPFLTPPPAAPAATAPAPTTAPANPVPPPAAPQP